MKCIYCSDIATLTCLCCKGVFCTRHGNKHEQEYKDGTEGIPAIMEKINDTTSSNHKT